MKVDTIRVKMGVTRDDPRNTRKDMRVIKECEIHIKGEVNILHPKFSVNGFDGYEDCNYMYIPAWKRYYFIDEIKLDNYLVLWVSGRVDALSTWWSYLKNVQCLIQRQEFVWNPFIQDTQLPVRTERLIEYQKIGNIGSPSSKGNNIVLTATGGKLENGQ